jgi:hypothetical protein
MRSLALVLLAMVAPACALLGHEKVSGWPQLEVIEHYVPNAEMRERCAKYVGFGMSPAACAEFDFAGKRCELWFSADFPPTQAILEHERLHCQGYDHAGATTLQGILQRYVASQQLARQADPAR